MKWNNYKKLPSISLIEKVENFFQVKFPSTFKETIFNYNGGQPEKDVFDTEQTENETFSALISFSENDKINVFREYSYIKDKIPNKVIPFGFDPGGNYICLDYRESSTNPKVVFWNHEMSIDQLTKKYSMELYKLYDLYFVANSFRDFIESLRESSYSFSDEDFDDAEIIDPDSF